ncbi:MAG: trypsin-like peptidase domain-containing protein [Proteobacteria bacterium]|nr:trypsin-like peptidase domain-containing protein [Pseudomonadota bacterium]
MVVFVLGAAPALAQAPGAAADASPYPMDTADAPSAAKKPEKPAHAAPAKPAANPATEAKAITPLPPTRPDALKKLDTAAAAQIAKSAPAPATPPAKEPAKDATKETAKETSKDAPKPDPLSTPLTATKEGDTLYGNAADERLLLQAALLWAGDYTGAAENGDDPLATAVKNFQKRKNYKVTGTLSDSERKELLTAARNYQDEFGWNVVVDPATGIRIGLPAKMVPIAHDAPRGTRWSSRHGDVQVETFRYADPNLKLATLFEREKQEPSTRRVEYSVLRDDSFFVSGIQGLRKFAVRASMRNGEIRGFTMTFDQMMEGIVAPVMVAMASAFSPFPSRAAPFAALSKSVEYGNGLVVSGKGHIVTDARLTRGCQVLVAHGLGDAERVADDADKGLTLLRVYGPRKLSPLSLTAASAKATAKPGDITLSGVPDPKDASGRDRIADIKARFTSSGSIDLRDPVPMAGFTGAAAIDGDGRFIGMMAMGPAVLASIQLAAPPVRLVRADAIRAFLDAHHVATPATAAGNPRDAVVRIICVRK